MNIVIYSTNSNHFDGNIFHYKNFPSNSTQLKELLLSFNLLTPENKDSKVIIVSQLPGMFLLDLENEQLICKNDDIEYFIFDRNSPSEVSDFVNKITEYKPDVAVAASAWVTPFDWLPVKDSLIAKELENKGIKTICNSLETNQICFDKFQTHNFLKFNGFNVANAVYVNHELFWAERNRLEIKENVYKEAVLLQIEKLNFPVIIKDTVSLSSFGMEVCRTFGQAKNYLLSKKNNSDRLVEEFIEGIQFGTEIWGTNEKNYRIHSPFMFSVNQYGITSPKQSVKLGPIENEKYKISCLKESLFKLAVLLHVNGIIQIDLVYNDKTGKWYIIEINPRLSGMTQILYTSQNKPSIAIKFPILENSVIEKLIQLPFVKHISQTVNDAAKQRRECGYCELIITSDSFEELKNNLNFLNSSFPEIMELDFFVKANQMLELN